MAAPVSTPQPQLLHLTVVNDLYAETPDRAFYAIREDRRHGWRLISRHNTVTPTNHLTVQACDAAITVLTAVKR